MELLSIDPREFQLRPHEAFNYRALLLTAGSFEEGKFNTMTIGWGFTGTMWSEPMMVVAVRPTRYTFGFMENYPDFTVTAFPKTFQRDLNILGTRSGRDGDKLAQTKLHAVAANHVGAPTFAEAELSVECKKLYWVDLDPKHFLDPAIHKLYELKDYHRIYYGRIEAIYGTVEYKA